MKNGYELCLIPPLFLPPPHTGPLISRSRGVVSELIRVTIFKTLSLAGGLSLSACVYLFVFAFVRVCACVCARVCLYVCTCVCMLNNMNNNSHHGNILMRHIV